MRTAKASIRTNRELCFPSFKGNRKLSVAARLDEIVNVWHEAINHRR